MLKPLRIFRHLACEGLGYLSNILDDSAIPYQLVNIDQGDPIPDRLDDISGLIFMGGPMSANDTLPWIQDELQLIEKAVSLDIPVLGHCLGAQLISKALGGVVKQNPVKEIGWHTVRTNQNLSIPWLQKIPTEFVAFHWHGETFSIPEGGQKILWNDHCENQAFIIGNTMALQCHIEMTPDMVRTWATEYAEEIQHPSQTVQSQQLIEKGIDTYIDPLQKIADRIYAQWLARLTP